MTEAKFDAAFERYVAERWKREEKRLRLRELRNQRCGAKTRAGHPCKRKALANGRCPNHGGLSTGPRTKAGRQRIAESTRRRWAQIRASRNREGHSGQQSSSNS